MSSSLRPRVVILSFMSASYVVEIYDCVLGYRVSWPRAKNDESAGHVLKCRGSFNDYNHNIHASNNAFLNYYHLLAYKEKIFFVHNYPEPSIFMLMNEDQAYSCFFVPEAGSFY